MKENYQIGSDVEWLKHSNEELARLARKRQRAAACWRFFSFLLLVALGWVVWKYTRKHPLAELWAF